MKRFLAIALTLALALGTLGMGALAETKDKLTIWSYGTPEYMRIYFQRYLDRENTGLTAEMANYSGEAEVRQQIMMTVNAGAMDDLPTAISTFPVSMQVLVEAGLLADITDYVTPYMDQFVEGAFDQATYNGRIYGMPYTLQPKMMFYNQEIFDKYEIDPARMATFQGYIEVGRELLEKSGGKVKLSYVDPSSYTWRYWFRRGLMPQANACIWDENGNVVFDTDPGTRLAMETFNTLLSEGMLMNVGIFSAEQYEAARQGEIATYYIESFWDTFLRGNLQDMSGAWRCMPAPVFDEVGTAGAQVIAMYCPVNTGNEEKTKLFVDMLLDFNLNAAERNQWTEDMLAMDYATEHPITKELQADPYWTEASDFYGGQSYRQMVTKSFENPSANLPVNLNDAEADTIISSEMEKWVAGSQDMETTITAIGRELRTRLNLQ
ncbi:MAG: ABC transporter substrate-binding protein [Clostridiales bacterium]|nr:ABC transporter substrate-binding protein [Clostridiales bacterium]MDY4009587.1 ABC transporter substrate-binding protein [Candidatus Limiplasma sp.]